MNTTFGTIGRLLVVTLAGFVLAGCRSPGPLPSRVDVRLENEVAYRQFWFHAIRSVKHFGYDLDRADPAAGVIASKPLTSKQWFEFWRNDTLAADQVAEASLQTIRRQINLTVHPTPNTGEYLVSAVVNVERQERPEQALTTPSNAVQAFNPRKTTSAQAAGIRWMVLGRDPVLEAAVLQQVAHWPGAKVIVVSEEATPASEPAEPGPIAQPEPAAE